MTTAAEELRAAAEELRDRSYFERTGEPDTRFAFDTALADWLETTAIKLHHSTHPDWQEAVAPHAIKLARLINPKEAPDAQ